MAEGNGYRGTLLYIVGGLLLSFIVFSAGAFSERFIGVDEARAAIAKNNASIAANTASIEQLKLSAAKDSVRLDEVLRRLQRIEDKLEALSDR